MAVEIIPAVLPHSPGELERGLHTLHGIAPLVQVDVVKDIFDDAESLPMWEELDFELDLFIEPAPFVERAIALGASRIVVHERFKTAREALEALQATRTGDFAVAVGLGLRAVDPAGVLTKYEGLYDYVQVMGIAQEGEQGHPPAPQAIELVRALRQAYPDLLIQVDGAVAPRVGEFADAGANRLVVGKAILTTDDPKGTYKQLYNEANGLK